MKFSNSKMQFLNDTHDELLDVNNGTCQGLCDEATILCNDLFGEIIGEWNGSAQSPNCVSFLCNGTGPRLWLAAANADRNTKSIVKGPERKKGLYLMFVVPLTEETRDEVSALARNSSKLKVLENKGKFIPQIFGGGFVRYGKGMFSVSLPSTQRANHFNGLNHHKLSVFGWKSFTSIVYGKTFLLTES